jgi:Domain of unknown function (DUF3846)
MPHPPNPPTSEPTMRAILVPADPSRPCTVLQVTFAQARELVGGPVERAVYDRDAEVLLDEDGHTHRRPLNPRATRYVREDSLAARQHGFPIGYVLVGDVLVVGSPTPWNLGATSSPDAGWHDAPARMVAYFHATTGEAPDGG